MVQLVRSLWLHKPEETPCGQPISATEAHAMLEIARESGITQNGLSSRLRLEKSTISRIVAMLERRGWIRRQRDEKDARFIRLVLTPRGTKANTNIAASRRAKFDKIFNAVPPQRGSGLVEALSLLLEVSREL